MDPHPEPKWLAIRPTPFTIYLRRSLAWQLVRFIVINLRMLAMILKSHQTRIPHVKPVRAERAHVQSRGAQP